MPAKRQQDINGCLLIQQRLAFNQFNKRLNLDKPALRRNLPANKQQLPETTQADKDKPKTRKKGKGANKSRYIIMLIFFYYFQPQNNMSSVNACYLFIYYFYYMWWPLDILLLFLIFTNLSIWPIKLHNSSSAKNSTPSNTPPPSPPFRTNPSPPSDSLSINGNTTTNSGYAPCLWKNDS